MKEFPEISIDEILKLKKIKYIFLYLLKVTPDYIYIKDKNHKFLYASESLAHVCGFESWEELVGKTDFDIFPKDHAKLYFEEEEQIISHGKEITAKEEPYYKDNELCYISTTKRPMFDEKGEIIGLFGISRDITIRKNIEKKLKEFADYDCLTGLYNRRMFFEQSTVLLEVCKRERTEAVLYFIDLDKFKDINDEFGHEAGDEVLKEVGRRLKNSFRTSDIVCRLGGDEFLIFTISHNEDDIQEKIKENINTKIFKEIEYRKSVFNITCSVGSASYPQDETTIEGLVRLADMRMYENKKE